MELDSGGAGVEAETFAGFCLQLEAAQFDFAVWALGKRLVVQNGLDDVVIGRSASLDCCRSSGKDDAFVEVELRILSRGENWICHGGPPRRTMGRNVTGRN